MLEGTIMILHWYSQKLLIHYHDSAWVLSFVVYTNKFECKIWVQYGFLLLKISVNISIFWGIFHSYKFNIIDIALIFCTQIYKAGYILDNYKAWHSCTIIIVLLSLGSYLLVDKKITVKCHLFVNKLGKFK